MQEVPKFRVTQSFDEITAPEIIIASRFVGEDDELPIEKITDSSDNSLIRFYCYY